MESFMRNIAANFCIDHTGLVEVKPFGSGHINNTFRVVFTQDGKEDKYIFQRINTHVFRNPDQLMENITRVLKHTDEKLAGQPDCERRCIHLVPARDGRMYYSSGTECWRSYHYISDARPCENPENTEQAYQASKAFGKFQYLLADLPGKRLHETIPDFHNTPSRFADFMQALTEDKCHRAAFCRPEIEFARKNAWIAPVLLELQQKGELPERITHNDTKLNNVLLDEHTGEGLCVIDLDTVMPGLSLYDFGDMVRSSISPAAEDETDLSLIQVRPDVFRALVRGFLEGAQGCLTRREIEMLPFAGILITYENGLRFLSDYLAGDVYYRTERENQNLDRCRTQFTLVQRLLEKEDELNAIVKEFLK